MCLTKLLLNLYHLVEIFKKLWRFVRIIEFLLPYVSIRDVSRTILTFLYFRLRWLMVHEKYSYVPEEDNSEAAYINKLYFSIMETTTCRNQLSFRISWWWDIVEAYKILYRFIRYDINCKIQNFTNHLYIMLVLICDLACTYDNASLRIDKLKPYYSTWVVGGSSNATVYENDIT